MTFAFFGGEPLAIPTLNKLKAANMLPSLIVCNPDRPAGRKQIMTPPPAKLWAIENDIPVFQPSSIKSPEALEKLKETSWDVFIVVAYNQIIPQSILDIPAHGTLNIHPSLLPKLRGASPIRSAILHDMRETGVTIMLMDAQMDHGPILNQRVAQIDPQDWPMKGLALDAHLAELGGELLAKTLPDWISGVITPLEQDHDAATFCGKIKKEDGEIDLSDDGYHNYLKFCAYDGWPGIFFFDADGKRIIIKEATYENGNFVITKILREGDSQETSY